MNKTLFILTVMVVLVLGRVSAFAQESDQPQDPPFAPLIMELSYPELFGGGTFVRELPAGEGVSIATAVTDPYGTLYYIISEREAVLATADVIEWDDLTTITHSFSIYAVTPSGGLFPFCKGRLPLKSYLAGLLFDSSNNGRLVIFVRTLVVDEQECGFLLDQGTASPAPATKSVPPDITVNTGSADTGSWDLSILEQCFFEKLSLIQITGHFEVLPQVPARPLNN